MLFFSSLSVAVPGLSHVAAPIPKGEGKVLSRVEISKRHFVVDLNEFQPPGSICLSITLVHFTVFRDKIDKVDNATDYIGLS